MYKTRINELLEPPRFPSDPHVVGKNTYKLHKTHINGLLEPPRVPSEPHFVCKGGTESCVGGTKLIMIDTSLRRRRRIVWDTQNGVGDTELCVGGT